MELSEVDELLQEMEATELELAKRINSTGGYKYHNEPVQPVSLPQIVDDTNCEKGKEMQFKPNDMNRRLDFQSGNKESADVLSVFSQKKSNNAFPDISLPYNDSLYLDETDKMISEFKSWEQSVQQPVARSNGCTTENIKNTDHLSNVLFTTISVAKPKEPIISQSNLCTNESMSTNNAQVQSKSSTLKADPVPCVTESVKSADSVSTRAVQYSNTDHLLDLYKISQRNRNLNDKEKSELGKSTVHVGTNTDSQLR